MFLKFANNFHTIVLYLFNGDVVHLSSLLNL